MFSTRKKWFLYLLLFFTFLLSLILTYLLFTPIDLTRYKTWIIPGIEEEVAGKVFIHRIVLKALPFPRVLLEGFEIREGEETILRSKTIRLKIPLRSLLKKRVEVRDLVFENPLLLVKREMDGGLNLVRIMKGRPLIPRDVEIEDGEVEFVDLLEGRGYHIQDLDAILTPRGPTISYKGVAKVLYGTEASTLSLKGEARGVGTGDMEISGEALLKGLNPDHYWPYVKGYLPGNRWDGTIELKASYTLKPWHSLSIKGRLNYSPITTSIPEAFEQPITSTEGGADIDIAYGPEGTGIDIRNATVRLPDLTVTGGLQVSKRDEAGVITLNLKTTPIPLPIVKAYIPMKILPHRFSEGLKDITLSKGTLNLELKLSGGWRVEGGETKFTTLNPEPSTLNYIRLGLRDAWFSYKGLKKPFTNWEGGFLWKGGVITLQGIKGRYGKTMVETMEGEIEEALTSPRLQIKASTTIDVGEFMEEFKGRIVALEKWEKADGAISLNLEASGKLEDISWRGKGWLKGFGLVHKDLPFPLQGLTGEVYLDKELLRVTNLKGLLGVSPFTMDGTVQGYLEERPFLDIRASGSLNHGLVKTFLKDWRIAEVRFDKEVDYEATLRGWKWKDLSISLSLDITRTNLLYSTWLEKDDGVPLMVETNLRIKEKGIDIEKGVLRFGASRLDMTGHMPYKGSLQLTIKTNKLGMDDLDGIVPYLKRGFSSRGMVSAQLKIIQGVKTRIDGEIRLTDGEFETTVLPRKVSKVGLWVRFSKGSVNLIVEGMEIGDSRVSGRIDAPNLSRWWDIRFNIVAHYLASEDLYPLQRKDILPTFTGSGSLTVKDGRFFGIAFSSLQTDVRMEPETISLDHLALVSYNGQITGGFVYYRSEEGRTLFASTFRPSGVEADQLLKGLGVKGDIISGRLYGEVELKARRGYERVIEGLEGKGRVTTRDGKLWRFVILSKIFSIVNIISINQLLEEGLPYRTVTGGFIIQGGVISTEDLTLDSNSMRMSAIGSINIPDRTIDAKLGIHPFVTIDKFITRIPLAGWIIGGKEKSTISMYYEIKGDIKDPQVEPVPIKSLGEKVFGIFLRILETPVEAVRPLVK